MGNFYFYICQFTKLQMIFGIYNIRQRFLVIDTVSFFMKRIGTTLTWHAEHKTTVNLNETRLRKKIFRQSKGYLLDITWELVLRRKDLARLCCVSGKGGGRKQQEMTLDEQQLRITRSQEVNKNPFRMYRKKKTNNQANLVSHWLERRVVTQFHKYCYAESFEVGVWW